MLATQKSGGITGRGAPEWAVLAAGLAIAAFVAAWFLLHHGFYARSQIIDTPIYQRYGDAMANGQVPYRDFALEYPPGALPVFVVPSLLRSDEGDLRGYRSGFEGEMLLCGALVLALMLSILLRLDAGPWRTAGALAFAALAPLAIGSVVLSRFDLWPALLTVAALAALVSGRNRLGMAALACAIAVKIYPAVLVPVVCVWVWRRAGRRELLTCLGIFGGLLLAIFLPFFVLSPHGVWHSLTVQTSRPLQIETLGSGLLLVLHQAGLGITMKSSHGSQNLAGGFADALAVLQTILQAAAIVAVWVWFARGPADRDRLIRAFAAGVCAFVAFGKVLSPQFLIWLIPLVPLVRGRRGIAASGLLAAALVITQLWFPFHYWDLVLHFEAFPSFAVLVRDLVLVALFVVLLREPRAAAPRSP